MDLPAPSIGRQADRDLLGRLRAETSVHHQQLEAALDLLRRPLDKDRFRFVLERFWGFHAVWEFALRRHPRLRVFAEPRVRLSHLRADLAALGRAGVDDLPLCHAAASLADSEAAAAGSMYVMEGSTLGGQVISRALTEADWAPAAGLTYFNPYGRQTGARWREFRLWAEGHVPLGQEALAVEGARRTFRLLQGWAAT